MNQITYLINPESNPICRDAMIPYAKSFGLPYDDVKNHEKYDTIIIDCGWKTPSYIKDVIKCIETHKGKVFLRVVDDYIESYEVVDKRFAWFIEDINEVSGVTFISPYHHQIYRQYEPIWIPYHYEVCDEVEIHAGRLDKAILTGFNDYRIYPFRGLIYKHESNLIESFLHPGYSGRCWNQNNVGEGYISMLAQYKFMIVTTCYLDYELMKYIECAEAGCVPVGEFPKYFLANMPAELRKLHCTSVDEIDDVIRGCINQYGQLSRLYREWVQSEFNKEKILNKIYSL